MAYTKADLKAEKLKELEKEQKQLNKQKESKKKEAAKKAETQQKVFENKEKNDLIGAKDVNKTYYQEVKKNINSFDQNKAKAQQFYNPTDKIPSVSAKAISSEAEKEPMSATQYGRTQLSNQIYDKYLAAEEYYSNPVGNSLEKGLMNRLRSAGGETVENLARVIDDNIADDPEKRIFDSKFADFLNTNAKNVVAKNTAGQIGDLADQQIMAAKENTGAFGDFLIDTADAGANMASQAILAGVLLPGAPAPVANKIFSGVQGVSSGAQKYVDTREAGGSKAEAWQRGIGSGAVAAITEGLAGIGKTGVSKIPGVNRVVTHLDEFATKNWLTNVLATGLEEGGEEGLEYAFEYASDVVADLIYKGEIETDFNVADLFQNVASGFVLGAGFGTVNYNPDAKPVETDTVAEPPVSPAEAPITEAENVTPETANEQEGALANAARRIKELQDDRYFVEVTLKNLEKRNPDTAAKDRVVWDEKLERINNEIESIIREVSPEALESNAQVNSANDVIETANAGEKLEAEKENNVEKAPEETLKILREQFDKGEISKEEYLAKNYENLAKYFEERKNANAQVNSTNDVVEQANDVVESANSQPRAQGDGGFGTNTVGAAQSNPNTYAHLQNEHGVFEPGEQPFARDPNVPIKDAQGNRVSQSVRTIMEAKVTPDELIPAFEKEVAAGTFQNEGTTNKEAVEKATKRFEGKSFGEALNEFRTLYSDDKLLSKDDVVFGEVLYSMAAQNGETDTAIELASLLVSNSSRTGDALQAQRILKRLTPEGRLYHAQQITNKFNKDKHQKTEIKLSEETVKKVLNAKTDKEIEAANDAVAEDVAKQIDKGFLNDLGSMWNAWRYLSMLGNPKTHIRNIFGNLAFLPVRKVKNVVKAGIESGAKKAGWIDEKTATVKLASKENREFAKESFEKNKKTLLNGGNYRFESEIDSKIEPFRSSGKETPIKKFFNAVLTPARKGAEFNSKALEAEDVWFLENAYIDSLTQYLTANKIDAQNMTPEQKTNVESYAAKEAQKATYRDYSAIANALEKLSNAEVLFKGRKIKLRPLVDAVVPFRKTPINVLARGVEYSPVGLATTILFDGKAVKDGNITANDMIDHLASGLTGSGLFALGMFLAKEGLISGGESDDENEKEFAKLQGEQAYALKIGDGSYTIDWLAPAALPVFVGVEAMKVLEKEYGNTENWTDTAWTILTNLDKIANPMLELSMLQNLDNFLGSNYSKDGSALSGLAQDLVASYALQAVPTLLSQVAQTVDGTRRNAYYVDKTDKIPDELQIPLQRAMAKIPGLSQKLPAYVDARGRKQEQSDNVGVRIVENFLSPGYYKKKTVTAEDEMLKQLIKQTGDTSLVPKGPSQKYVTVDGTDHPLSAKEYEQMSIEKGKKQYDILSQLVANKTYEQLDAETKAKAVKGVYEYSGALSKEGVHGYKLPEVWVKAEKAKEDGLAEGTYISLKSSMSDKEKDIDKINYLIADKGTAPKEKVIAMEYLTDINMDKYKKFSNDPEDIINARKIYLEEDAKGGEGTTTRMVDRMIKDKGTTSKEDVAFMENVLNMNMEKYKSATNKPEEQLELYKVVSDSAKKEEDIKALAKKGYSNAEALAKYNVSSGTKKYENGEFKFGNSTKQKAKAEKLKAKGYDPEEIVKAANAVTSFGKYGTSKNYNTYVEMLNSVGIKDKKFIQDFWNTYM